MKTFGYIVGMISAFALVFGVLIALSVGTTWFYRTTDTRIDNSVFHASQQYNDGMVSDLDNLRMAYYGTNDPQAKQAIADTVRHRFASYDPSKLPDDDRAFLMQFRN